MSLLPFFISLFINRIVFASSAVALLVTRERLNRSQPLTAALRDVFFQRDAIEQISRCFIETETRKVEVRRAHTFNESATRERCRAEIEQPQQRQYRGVLCKRKRGIERER